ncbi:hypothetical protein MD484_g967, partial [Candolleomyces efflorescens]
MILTKQIPKKKSLDYTRECVIKATRDVDAKWTGEQLCWVVHSPILHPTPTDPKAHFTLRGYSLLTGYAIRTLHVYSDIPEDYHPYENGGYKFGPRYNPRTGAERRPRKMLDFNTDCVSL